MNGGKKRKSRKKTFDAATCPGGISGPEGGQCAKIIGYNLPSVLINR